MSSPRNNILVEQNRISGVPIDTTASINAGDMLKWDAANHIAKPVEAGDAGSTVAAAAFIGVSQDTNPITSIGKTLPTPRLNVVNKGLIEFYADDNATYYPGDYVCLGSDPQKVKKTAASSSNAIGVVAPENFFSVASGVTQGLVAVQGTTKLKIYIRPQYQLLSSF